VVDDRDIIRSSLENPAEFEEIFDRHWATVLRYACQRTGTDAGEEIAARTFLIAFERRNKFGRGSPSAGPWLLGIATNLIRRHRRRERAYLKARRRILALPPERPTLDRPDLNKLSYRALLVQALMKLDARERDAFLLSALAGLSYPEISIALGIPIGTVRSRINRARSRLRELIGPEVAIEDVIGE